MKKFFERVEAAFKKLFGNSTWEKTASATITYVEPLLSTLALLVAGQPAETLVNGILNTAKSDLATVAAIVDDATSTPPANELAAAQQALTSLQTNFSSILAAAEVKNSAEATKITAITNTIIGEVEAILENIPSAAAPAAPSAPAATA